MDEELIPGTSAEVASAYRGYAKLAQTAAFGLVEDEIVVLDTETTGMSFEKDELIEIAASVMSGPKVTKSFQTFVRPSKPIPRDIVKLTGITDAMVQGAPSAEQAVAKLRAFAQGRLIVAHNAGFDKGFIEKAAYGEGVGGGWVDSLELARIALPRLRNHSLAALCRAFGVENGSEHRATGDVEALCKIWRVILVALDAMPPGFLNFLKELMPSVDWPARAVISHLAAADPDARLALAAWRLSMTRQSRLSQKVDACDAEGDWPTVRQVGGFFDGDGPIARVYSQFEARPEQLAMATEVVSAFSSSTHRLIEAGTGVGKSIAYLVPAALAARKLNIGIGVATKTNALADQLVYQELPKLKEALGGELEYVSLKGYEHYPCLHRLQRLASGERDTATLSGTEAQQGQAEGGGQHGVREQGNRARNELAMIAAVTAFALQTPFGDLDAMNFHWDASLRSKVAANSSSCLRRRCPFYPNACMIHGLRNRAKCADIVVTNHALLFRDVIAEGGILPPIRHWIVDEAHSAPAEARSQLSPHIRAADLLTVVDDITHSRSSGVVAARRVAGTMDGSALVLAKAALLADEAYTTQSVALNFFSLVKELPSDEEVLSAGLGDKSVERQKGAYEVLDVWISPAVRESPQWGRVVSSGRALATHMKKLATLCTELGGMFESGEDAGADVRLEMTSAAGYLNEMRGALSLLLDGSESAYVYSACVHKNPDRWREDLRCGLLDVGKALAEEFYPRCLSVVLTSATLSTGAAGGKASPFRYFEHEMGFDRLEKGKASSLALASGYDYDRQMKVLVANDVPEPSQPGYIAELCRLLEDVHEKMGGAVLTLFTNRRDMEEAFERTRRRIEACGVNLICQRRGRSARQIRDEFLSDKRTCLFALRSFWEGFDAPGDTLRCVVVTRLPFSRPDPLSKERGRLDKAAFSHYSLPEAVLSLKQAAGRLIRSSTDEGYLVIADSRILTKRYGRAFLAALPSASRRSLPSSRLAELIE